ncbi:MAG TPA: M56 family metallopeptidase [Streptosporangiaceae bacterium]|jgi:Zn-dependent protease with chaperone function
MFAAALLAVVCFGCVVAAIELAGADWPWRGPRTAILLWQAIGLSWGVAAIGTLLGFGLSPYGRGVAWGGIDLLIDVAHHRAVQKLGWFHLGVTIAGLVLGGVLLFMVAAAGVEVIRARRRHRTLLALVGHGDPDVPGALIVDHPAATAYCVPGVRAQVVVSAGALRLLDHAELAAVLAHERTHARWRHDLVLLPFNALRRMLPSSQVAGDAERSVGLLVEMSADDGAARGARRPLATALLRIGAAGGGTPCGALGVGGGEVVLRVNRLLRPAPSLPARARLTALIAAVSLLTVPVLLLCVPL